MMKIDGDDRHNGIYVAGKSGSGKSSLIQQMILHDIRADRGVGVIDPTADLVNTLLHWIPKSRVADTILFDTDKAIPLDFFSYRNLAERDVLTDLLVSVFKLDGAPMSKPRLQRVLGTLFDANENGGKFTFLDIAHFLEDKTFRSRVTDLCPHRRKEWVKMPEPKELVTIIERLTPFTESRALKIMFGSHKGLNISEVMETKKIFLANLKDTATDFFIGSLLSAKFQQATFGRRYIPEEDRIPYYLYIDECHTILDYAVKEFETILTRARKYKLCLLLANQFPSDLPEPILRKVTGMGTLILFNLPPSESHIFTKLIHPYGEETLSRMKQYTALCLTKNTPTIITTPHRLGRSPASYAEDIRNRPVESEPCDTAPNGFNKGNGVTDPTDSKEDTIEGSGPPNVPPYGDQAKGPRTPR